MAAIAKVSQTRVSDAELGRVEHFTIRTLEAICSALGVHLKLDAWWRGTQGHRLIDRTHAAVVEAVIHELAAMSWIVIPEYTFNHYGERGSVDVVAWMPFTRSLLIIEVKSEIVDLQDLFATLGRKVRVVPALLRAERGWNPATVSKLVVLPGSTANRSVISRHEASFAAALPARSFNVKLWLRAPNEPIAGVWFISPTRVAGTKRVLRVRRPRPHVAAPVMERERDGPRLESAVSDRSDVCSTRHVGR